MHILLYKIYNDFFRVLKLTVNITYNEYIKSWLEVGLHEPHEVQQGQV